MGQTQSNIIKPNESQQIKPVDLMNTLKNNIGSNNPFFDRADEINELIASGNKAIACGPTCQKKKKTDDLYKTYQDAQANESTAPEQVNVAAKNYYTYAEGPTGYNNFHKEELTKQINKITDEMSNQFSKNLLEANLLNKDYNTSYINSINTQDLYNNYLEKNATLKSEIKEVSGDIFTNDRKTHYEDEQIYGLYGLNWWYVLFAWIYGIIVVSFFICIFFVYSNYTLTRKIIILILLVIYPFICTRLAIYFIKIWNYIGSLFPKIAVLKF